MGMRIFPEVSGSFDAHASPRNMRPCPQWFLLKNNRKILRGNIGKFGMEKSARGIMYSSLPPIVVHVNRLNIRQVTFTVCLHMS